MNPARILHPIDLSHAARPALAQALALAKWHDADLHCVTVKARRSTVAEIELREFVNASNVASVRFRTAVLSGEPVAAVAAHARLIRPDLLVVARSGRPRGILARPGAFAHELARASGCPTLMVPERHGAPATFGTGSFRHILCATDGSAAAAAGLNHALVLAQQSGGRLSVLRVLDGRALDAVFAADADRHTSGAHQPLIERQSRALVDAIPADALNWCDVRINVLPGVPYRTILSTIEHSSPDLAVLGMRTSHGATIFMRSTAGAVMRRAGCHILLIPVPSVERARGRRVVPADRRLLPISVPAAPHVGVPARSS
jgi:nucleotide-binding universal stress UspA family protein